MALAITKIYAGSTGNGVAEATWSGATFTSGSFVPGNNCLLLVISKAATSAGTGTFAPSISGGSLSWTTITAASGVSLYSTTKEETLCAFYAPVTTGASMTVTCGMGYAGTGSVTTSAYYIEVYQITGHDAVTPIGATALTLNNTTNAATITLTGAPASSSIKFSSCTSAAAAAGFTGVSGGASYTVIENSTGNLDWICGGSEYITGSTSTSIPWVDVITGSSVWLGLSTISGIEIRAGATGPATPADCSFLFQASANLRHAATVDTNQPLNDTFSGRLGATPTQLAFWFQPPFLGPTPKSTQNTNQAFYISPAEPKTTGTLSYRTLPVLARHVPTVYTAQSFLCNPTIGPPIPGSWYTQVPNLLNHPNTLDTNQPLDQGWTKNITPESLAFWRQPHNLLHHPATIDTNQPFNADFSGWTDNLTPDLLGFWTQAPDLVRHAVTLDTNQPFQVFLPFDSHELGDTAWWTQPPDLLRHPARIDTNQAFDSGYAGWGSLTPEPLGFFVQAPTLLPHPPTVDTNQPLDDTFFGWASGSVTPDLLGFWTQAPDLLKHPATLDTRQQFEFNPPPQPTPADCSFLFQPSALLKHAQTVDTNQALDDAFAGWTKPLTPASLGFWRQPPELLCHPNTVDTNQAFNYAFAGIPGATPAANLAFFVQPPALLRHPVTVDTNQAFVSYQVQAEIAADVAFFVQPPNLLKHPATVDTNQLFQLPTSTHELGDVAWWTQPQNLLRHPATVDTNQPRVSYQVFVEPAEDLAFFLQPQHLLRHPATVDTNQPRVSYQQASEPAQDVAFWCQPPALLRHPPRLDTNQPFSLPFVVHEFGDVAWFTQPPDLLRHPSALDTNQTRLLGLLGQATATPSSLAFWRQAPELLKHPTTLDTRQSFQYLSPLPPPFGWLVQTPNLLWHPVPSILGGQYSFALVPPKPRANAIIRITFFD